MLLESRNYFKPFKYPFAFDAYKLQNQMHWLPTEVGMDKDLLDWNTKLIDSEKNLITHLFRFFTQGDIDIASGYRKLWGKLFGGHPEIAMMISSFQNIEAIHVHAYSYLLETLGMPEAEYKAFLEFDEMRNKHRYLHGYIERIEKEPDWFDIAKGLAVFSGFGEGMQLFSSFATLLSFPKRGLLNGMGQMIQWSCRDEEIHVANMCRLFKLFVDEYGINKLYLESSVKTVCKDMVEMEDKFIDLMFEMGDLNGLSKVELKEYIRFLANRRLEQLGFTKMFSIDNNPLPWVNWMMTGVEHTNFFENRSTEYSKGSIRADIENVEW
jgi:ribonucleoside-diphosphate reductase beta chain